jgi:hypothetical protein
MKYVITSIDYAPSELEPEVIFIEIEMSLTEPEVITLTGFVPLSKLLHHLKQHHPTFYNYWHAIRGSIDQWGPAEASTLEAIGEEARSQLNIFLKEYITITQWAAHTYQYHKNLQVGMANNPAQLGELEAAAKKMHDMGEEVRESQLRYRQFCERVEKQARAIALDVYPALQEIEADEWRAFKHVFTNEIINMHTALSKFMED